ncbi:hypothetical protein CLOM_g22249 [Closterium sp. NIES-68]|nr:hypothetical protein CLOM_g22249 [Closterium sp. NIES-68]GJP80771.1 hypothetical protein CLOP_g10973 [Closterium sp. NIES-67]
MGCCRIACQQSRCRRTAARSCSYGARPVFFAPLLLLAVLANGSVAAQAQKFQCSANPAVAAVKPKYANRFFREISTLYNMSSGESLIESAKRQLTSGSFSFGLNWADDPRLESVLALRSEGKCRSSWAITAVSAVEMAYALVAASTPSMDPPAQISLQQVLDCEPSSSSCGGGGWPTAALDYMVDATNQWGGIATETAYPYAQKTGKCSRGKAKDATTIGVTGYDQVDFYGWMGLLLAVNVQPTIALVRGSHPSFQTYTGATEKIYSDPACAAAGVVDHSVLVMGYNIGQWGAYWILRNSWGAKWGIQGHMAMAMTGGSGICGIHSVPAIYPVIKTCSPCKSHQNPCGGGICVPGANGTYTCKCLKPLFLPAADRGGAQTCVWADVCSVQDENPCAVGTCINDQVGGYVCLCPPGFVQGVRPNGSPTCVPTTSSPTTLSFPVDVDCPLVYQLFGLTEEAFLAQNPQLEMDYCDTIPANTEVSVVPPLMGSVHCGSFYSWTPEDSCESVADAFGLTVDELVALNPGVNCTDASADNAPRENQQLCVSEGNGADLPMCTQWYTVQAGDTCDSIMADNALNDTTFFSLNPGVCCDSLFPSFGGEDMGWVGGGVQVCIDAYLVDAPGPYATPRSLRELPAALSSLPSSHPSLPSFHPSHSSSSSSSSFSSSSSLSTRGRLLGLDHSSPHSSSFPQLPTLSAPRSSRSMRGRQLARARTKCKASYSVTRGDFCARIIALKFQNSARKMADLNSGYVCVNDRLYVGLTLCTRR